MKTRRLQNCLLLSSSCSFSHTHLGSSFTTSVEARRRSDAHAPRSYCRQWICLCRFPPLHARFSDLLGNKVEERYSRLTVLLLFVRRACQIGSFLDQFLFDRTPSVFLNMHTTKRRQRTPTRAVLPKCALVETEWWLSRCFTGDEVMLLSP